ncbi:MAG TPA: nicotinate (nicotinamide) nucleotide adenylyltransferase [Burkholderiaceae bacterium]|nr:nicotinate (nicotinamide) nucleotide adenylyltransferase [Burkholderiaceae bacterium]HMX11437.1 nicotinate (nicotinamide) nucleotide adenylyltransferase [Burkholderiaceae bacterium]HMY99794.1 nicotinate (nicotinamide) nucleotide adenylyltransferase [Burkholderiaceae bacterium]HNB43650.1 nicotinate (nicotinamide) nucleotide adenylyltransferase [Burkholderiaceae bacterium]HNG78948.1 nicotinate (nicotinamide) nucleotide adenylyltransferase [Burkholderiaceae bacterium]
MTLSVPPRRIGLFGGSFDPVHVGHRRLAECALQQLGLDELRWVVAGQPWQKARQLEPAEDRAAMVALAIADEPRFRLERCELDRAGPSFTIDTVERLQAEDRAHATRPGEPAARWFLLIGQDQYANLTTWRRWRELLERVELAVAARDGQAPQPSAELAALPHRLHHLVMPPVAVSSTALRLALAGGASPSSLVPDGLDAGVADYLAARGLYHSTPAQSG